MEKKIEIKIPKHNYNIYLAMHIPESMEASELLKIIEANELAEFNIHSGHIKFKGEYRNSGELENRMVYDVHTSDPDKTINLIKNFNNKNYN